MRRAGLIVALLPAVLGAQTITVQAPGALESAALLRSALAQPHVLRSSGAQVDLPRDSSISQTVIVVGRSATVASKVHGDVIVVGGDLFLHPGVDISGNAIAIGGMVAQTSLGHVSGTVRSFSAETYDFHTDTGASALSYRSLVSASGDSAMFGLAGIQGVIIPSYDRVNGLSFPVGAVVNLPHTVIQPSLTYRSRLGALDPRVDVRVGADSGLRFEGVAGMLTRSNEEWIYSDLVNSALSLFAGIDTRNYFRSRDVEGRVVYHTATKGRSFEPYVGGRFERTSAITAVGNVFSFVGRHSDERMARPNPFVEGGNLGSVLAGAALYDTSGVVSSRIRADVEQGVSTMAGTSSFTQLTLDGRVSFPTFGTQSLTFRGHGVATAGSSVPRARYAYLGGTGSIPVVDLLELGGTDLLFIHSRYLIPLARVVLPVIGSPVLSLDHYLGSAGVGSLPPLEQVIGAGIGLSALNLTVNTDVARHRGTKFGASISLGH